MEKKRLLIVTLALALMAMFSSVGCGLFMSPKVVVTGSRRCCGKPMRKYKAPRPGRIRQRGRQNQRQPQRQPQQGAGDGAAKSNSIGGGQ